VLDRLSDILIRISKGWLAASAFVIFLLFTALVLPRQSAMAEATSGGADAPDTSLYYTPEDLYRMAEAYGEDGRAAYIRARFTFDVIWPLVYLFFLATSISWICSKLESVKRWHRRANLVPLVGAIFDYMENVFASTVMWRYPLRTALVDILAPISTLLKWVFIGASFLLLIVGFALGIWRMFSKS
jgi:hypothetical protein